MSGSEDKTIQLWDAKTGKMLQPPLEGHEDGVWAIAFSPDGKHIVSESDDRTIHLLDTETGEIMQPTFKGHEGGVWAVAFSPDGKHIVSGSSDKTIQLWDAATGEMLQPPAFLPDDKHIKSESELAEQHLICFSPHQEHALVDVVKLIHDITPLSQHKCSIPVQSNIKQGYYH